MWKSARETLIYSARRSPLGGKPETLQCTAVHCTAAELRTAELETTLSKRNDTPSKLRSRPVPSPCRARSSSFSFSPLWQSPPGPPPPPHPTHLYRTVTPTWQAQFSGFRGFGDERGRLFLGYFLLARQKKVTCRRYTIPHVLQHVADRNPLGQPRPTVSSQSNTSHQRTDPSTGLS